MLRCSAPRVAQLYGFNQFGERSLGHTVAVGETQQRLFFAASSGVVTAPLEPSGAGPVLRSLTELAGGPRSDAVDECHYAVSHVAVHPHEHVLAVAQRRLKVAVYLFEHFPQSKLLHRIDDVAKVEVSCMEFSPDGLFLAVLRSLPDPSLLLYPLLDRRESRHSQLLTGSPRHIALGSQPHQWLAICPSDTRYISVWGPDSGVCLVFLSRAAPLLSPNGNKGNEITPSVRQVLMPTPPAQGGSRCPPAWSSTTPQWPPTTEVLCPGAHSAAWNREGGAMQLNGPVLFCGTEGGGVLSVCSVSARACRLEGFSCGGSTGTVRALCSATLEHATIQGGAIIASPDDGQGRIYVFATFSAAPTGTTSDPPRATLLASVGVSLFLGATSLSHLHFLPQSRALIVGSGASLITLDVPSLLDAPPSRAEGNTAHSGASAEVVSKARSIQQGFLGQIVAMEALRGAETSTCVAVLSISGYLHVIDCISNCVSAPLWVGQQPTVMKCLAGDGPGDILRGWGSVVLVAFRTGSVRLFELGPVIAALGRSPGAAFGGCRGRGRSYGNSNPSEVERPEEHGPDLQVAGRPPCIFSAKVANGGLQCCDARVYVERDSAVGRAAVSDGSTMYFFEYGERSENEPRGRAPMRCVGRVSQQSVSSPWVTLELLPTVDAQVLAGKSNGEVELIQFPTADHSPGTTTQSEDTVQLELSALLVNSWRLDVPFRALAAIAVFDGSANIVAQSADRDTKLYVLDLTLSVDRRDRDSKVVKPLFIMRHHEKEGRFFRVCRTYTGDRHPVADLSPVPQILLLSTGNDGRVALLDVTHYSTPLESGPPMREKRPPLLLCNPHIAEAGGAVSAVLLLRGTYVASAGAEGVVQIWSTGVEEAPGAASPMSVQRLKWFALPRPILVDWIDGGMGSAVEPGAAVVEGTLKVCGTKSVTSTQGPRCGDVAEAVHRARTQLAVLWEENSRIPPEGEEGDAGAVVAQRLPLLRFLHPNRQSSFESECDEAIQAMETDTKYTVARNAYIVEYAKQNCWNTMKVPQMVITGLNASTGGPRVYSFHECRGVEEEDHVLAKLVFLRRLQIQAFPSRPGVTTRPAFLVKTARTLAGETVDNSLCEAGGLGGNDLYDSLLYTKGVELATRHGVIIQVRLLNGLLSVLKREFNSSFGALRQRKRQDVSRIEERNARCEQIVRELGEAMDDAAVCCLSSDTVAREAHQDDASVLFSVTDEEVALRHPNVSCVQPECEGHPDGGGGGRSTYRGQDEDEAQNAERALRQWMSGLERESRALINDVAIPDFADEQSERFVPADERSDEQLLEMKRYEAAFEKREGEINALKEVMRSEYQTLQKESLALCSAFDGSLRALWAQWYDTAQRIGEIELYQVELVKSILFQENRARLAARMRTLLSQAEMDAAAAELHLCLSGQQVDTETATLTALLREEAASESGMRTESPFSDSVHGDQLLRVVNRRRPVRSTALLTASGAGDMESHRATAAAIAAHFRDTAERAGTLDTFPHHLVVALQLHLQRRLAMAEAIAKQIDAVAEARSAQRKAEQRVADARCAHDEAATALVDFVAQSRRHIFEMGQLYRLRQGQVEVPAPESNLLGAFGRAVLTITDRLHWINSLIKASAADVAQLIQGTYRGKKRIHRYEWETEFLDYCVATLEMEQRHLHTLRVTREIQEFVARESQCEVPPAAHKGAHVAKRFGSVVRSSAVIQAAKRQEDVIERLQRQLACVRGVAAEKLQQRADIIAGLKRRIRDHRYEKQVLEGDAVRLAGDIADRVTVCELQHGIANGAFEDQRMREIREARSLEDLARDQQEEMLALKHEVDHLRERTYPSFAVVSKHRIG